MQKEINYPDLSDSNILATDIETYDPLLTERGKGPGVYRRDGNILGVSLANEKGFGEYYNLGHKVLTVPLESVKSWKLSDLPMKPISMAEKKTNIAFLKKTLAMPMKKLGAKLLYDLDWLENWAGIPVAGELHDVQIAEPLINEHQRSFSLDNLALKYLGRGKYKDEIQKFCDANNLKGDPRKWLWVMPFQLVRAYAIEDVAEPIEIFEKQWAIMKEEGLLDVYHLEIGISRLLLQMRKNGARIDVAYVNKTIKELKSKIVELEKVLFNNYGKFNYNSSKQIATVFDKVGIPYKTIKKTGNPSITKDDLMIIDKPIAKEILEVKKTKKALQTFFINTLTESRVGERIHTSFNQLKADEYGTITGRFSSSNPNLQQIPARDKYIGPLCRRAFIPEEDCWYGKIDWSQIEYRIIAQYAEGPGAEEIRKQYRDDPTTDYHEVVMQLTGLERKPAKNLNFGMAYFMGANTCSAKFHWTVEESKQLIALYHEKVPFVRYTGKQVSAVARGRGYIKTITKRRSRVTPEMLEQRKEFVMFNHLIQGTAADIMKIAMKQAYDEGLFKILTPHLTVHDELGVSIPKTNKGIEAYLRLKWVMENCVKLSVPVVADAEYGSNWQDVQSIYDEEGNNRMYGELNEK